MNKKHKELNIDTSQTSAKYLPLVDDVLTFLIDVLQALNVLEQEIFERYEVLASQRVSRNQTHPEEADLWKEYAKRSYDIIAPIHFKPYKETSRSFGKPTKYEYLSYPNTLIVFIIKSANRAVVEMYFERGIKKQEQFVLKQHEGTWKIDTKKYSFPDEDTWWKDEL